MKKINNNMKSNWERLEKEIGDPPAIDIKQIYICGYTDCMHYIMSNINQSFDDISNELIKTLINKICDGDEK